MNEQMPPENQAMQVLKDMDAESSASDDSLGLASLCASDPIAVLSHEEDPSATPQAEVPMSDGSDIDVLDVQFSEMSDEAKDDANQPAPLNPARPKWKFLHKRPASYIAKRPAGSVSNHRPCRTCQGRFVWQPPPGSRITNKKASPNNLKNQPCIFNTSSPGTPGRILQGPSSNGRQCVWCDFKALHTALTTPSWKLGKTSCGP